MNKQKVIETFIWESEFFKKKNLKPTICGVWLQKNSIKEFGGDAWTVLILIVVVVTETYTGIKIYKTIHMQSLFQSVLLF